MIPVFQESDEEPVWQVLGGGKDDVYIYDRCGRLAYYIPMPLSLLNKPYVEAAILSAYFNDPCGLCDETAFEESNVTTNNQQPINATVSEDDYGLAESETISSETNTTITEKNPPHKRRPHPGAHPHRQSGRSRGNHTHHHHNGNNTHRHHHHHHHHRNHTDGNHTIPYSDEVIGGNEELVSVISDNITVASLQKSEIQTGNNGTENVTPTPRNVTQSNPNAKRRKAKKHHRKAQENGRQTARKGRERNRTMDAPESRIKRQALAIWEEECSTTVNLTRCREWKPKFQLVKQCCRLTPDKQVVRLKTSKCSSLSDSKCLKVMKFKECCKKLPRDPRHNHHHKDNTSISSHPKACDGFNDHVCRMVFQLGFTRSDCCSKELYRSNYTPLLKANMCQHFDSALCSKLQYHGLNHKCCRNRTPKMAIVESAICERTLRSSC